MYIPSYYRVDDRERIQEMLTQYPFGVLVAIDGTRPIAVHMPFEWHEADGRLVLQGHVAKGNAIWRAAPDNPEVLAIFQGPHTYISPSWYEDPNVPTWNYVAVHVYGTCRVMTDAELETFLELLMNRYEDGRPGGRPWHSLTSEFRQEQMRGIVGLSIDVARIEAAAKMSQNRSDQDFHHVVETLQSSPDPQDVQVAQIMKTIRPGLF